VKVTSSLLNTLITHIVLGSFERLLYIAGPWRNVACHVIRSGVAILVSAKDNQRRQFATYVAFSLKAAAIAIVSRPCRAGKAQREANSLDSDHW
jgi:uncharacterized membrane protein